MGRSGEIWGDLGGSRTCIEKMTSSFAATSLGATAPSPLKEASMASHTARVSTLPDWERQRCSGRTRLIARITACHVGVPKAVRWGGHTKGGAKEV